MKTQHLLLIALVSFMASFSLSAQSLIGVWAYEDTAPDGTAVTNTISMQEDGTLTVDFASDGQVEVMATYTIDGDKITINDTIEQSPCYGKAGIYRFQAEENTITISLVEDVCDVRRRDRPWTLTRKE